MAEKLSVWRLQMVENLQAGLAKVGGWTDATARKFDGLQGKITKLQKEFKGAIDEIPGAGRALELATNPYLASAAAVAGAGVALYGATKDALAFDKGMHKINVTARLTQPELDKLRDKLIGLGSQSTVPLAQIPDAFNQVISAVGDAEKATGIFEAALKGAQAGGTEVKTVAEALTNVMGAVGNATPTEALDTLFATLRVGKAEFADIAQYLPKVIPLSNNAGFGFQQIAGAFALMTTKGQTAEATTTLLQNAMQALTKTSVIYGDASHAGFVRSGVAIFDQQGRTRQLTAIIDDLASKTNGMTDKQRQAFLAGLGLDQQAAAAFSVLAQNAGDLKTFINETTNSAGELSEAYERSLSPADRMTLAGQRYDALMLRLGYQLIPAVEAALRPVNAAIDWAEQHTRLFGAAWDIATGPIRLAGSLIDTIILKPLNALMGTDGKGLSEWLVGDTSVLSAFTDLVELVTRTVSALVNSTVAAADLDFDKAQQELYDWGNFLINGDTKTPAAGGAKTANVQGLAGGGKPAGPGAGGTGAPDLKAGLKDVNAGGRSVRNVTVNIGAVGKEINVMVSGQTPNLDRLVDQIKRDLIRAIAGAEQSLATD